MQEVVATSDVRGKSYERQALTESPVMVDRELPVFTGGCDAPDLRTIPSTRRPIYQINSIYRTDSQTGQSSAGLSSTGASDEYITIRPPHEPELTNSRCSRLATTSGLIGTTADTTTHTDANAITGSSGDLSADNRFVLGLGHLKSTSRVCKLWQNCCDREVRYRCHRVLVDHLFYGFAIESSVSSDADANDDTENKPFVLSDRQSVVKRLCDYYKSDIQLIPQLVVMFNAKLSREEGWYAALKVNAYRKYLPKDCLFIHLETQTIIGTSDHNRCPYPAANGLAGISHLLLSRISGLEIDVYYDQEICESLKADPDMKCILYFESAKDYDRRDTSDQYLWHNCNHHMWEVMKQMEFKLAFGGTRVTAIDVSAGYESAEAEKPFACIAIRGPNVSACSIEMKTGNLESTERLLTEFKSRLGFDADDRRLSTTFAFVFCRIIPYRFNRYCHFKEGESSQLIHRIFPNVIFAGAISVINFGQNYWPGMPVPSHEESNYKTTLFDSTIIMSNESISGGEYEECVHNEPNHRIADNYELCLKHSLVNNYLIMENIFKWLEPSELIKCSQVCIKWKLISQLIAYKRQYFSHKLLYFGLLSTQSAHTLRDKYLNIFRESFDEAIDSYNNYLSRNRLKEFQLIIVFSKLDFHRMEDFLVRQHIPNDCTIIQINCRNEVIGTQELIDHKYLGANQYVEYESDFDLLSAISAFFMSRAMPGIEVHVYNDSNVFHIKSDENLKCILVFHIWRSFFGHFSRLKTDNQYLEYLEQFVHQCNHNIAFGGVTVDRLAASQATDTDNCNQYIDYICCLTFSGSNVKAFSYVIDFSDTYIESHLKSIYEELQHNLSHKIETTD
ncbi:unnamed protein product [Oppiella nova]|uniref:F-box domain-containing protein n=1 Tax=Oppiella nova TaxID=334625 RepID=A0A7R9QBA0_9ACAR|nr:unnamed protein product [Oppiella nova]CAG2162463.1 unnamed protein product [Oppiella nova]